MASNEAIIELMAASFPRCPLCGSARGYSVTSVIKGRVQCRSCLAEWYSPDFAASERLERLTITQLPGSVHWYPVGEHILRRYEEHTVDFWRSLSREGKMPYRVGACDVTAPLLEFSLLFLTAAIGGYFRLTNLSEISSWHDFDEGVHSQAAILYIQGYTPYKDFIFTHPPLILYALNVICRFTGPNLGAARTFSAVLSTLTIITVYFIGKTSGSPIAGYIASAFVALDGYTIYNSRKAMLEPSMTFFACLSYLFFVHSIEREDSGTKDTLMLLSGVLIGLSFSAKAAAIANWAPLFIYLALRREKRALIVFLFSSLTSAITPLIPFIVATQGEVLKQVLVFQALRPADGTPKDQRLKWMTSYRPEMIIVNLGIFSLVTTLLAYVILSYLHLRRKTPDSLSKPSVTLPMLWVLSVLFLFLSAKSFYGHYVEQIIPPFALLIGNTATEIPRAVSSLRGETLGKTLKVFLVFAFAVALTAQFAIMTSERVPSGEDRTPREKADKLAFLTAPNNRILTFEPLYTFMARRTPTGLMCDCYGTMLYIGLGLDRENLVSAFVRALTGREYQGWPMHDPAAQSRITELAKQSDYMILGDYRSNWQLTRETMDYIRSQAVLVEDLGGIQLLARSNPTARQNTTKFLPTLPEETSP